MAKIRVLIVEDNTDMREAVSAFLVDKGYSVTAVDTSEKVIDKNLYDNADIILADISLPGMSGLELTSFLKRQAVTAPIIAITARDTIDDRVHGLSTGMSDYIVKPFDLRELDARIKAQLRSSGKYQDMATIVTKNFKIEPKTHRFSKNDKVIKLTLVEFRIMLRLMQNNFGIVNSEDIIEFAWGEDANIVNPPIRIHISNLRSKIGDEQLTVIQTIPGVGYMLQD